MRGRRFRRFGLRGLPVHAGRHRPVDPVLQPIGDARLHLQARLVKLALGVRERLLMGGQIVRRRRAAGVVGGLELIAQPGRFRIRVYPQGGWGRRERPRLPEIAIADEGMRYRWGR